MRDFSATKESPKHHFTLMSLKFLSKSFKREYGCQGLIKQHPTTSNNPFWKSIYQYAEAVVRMCSVKKVF